VPFLLPGKVPFLLPGNVVITGGVQGQGVAIETRTFDTMDRGPFIQRGVAPQREDGDQDGMTTS